MPAPFVSKRAPIYRDVPDEKWNDWRWQLSNRLNSVEDIEKILPLSESERKALQTQGLFRVDVTPYFISLIDPEDPEDPEEPLSPLIPELPDVPLVPEIPSSTSVTTTISFVEKLELSIIVLPVKV